MTMRRIATTRNQDMQALRLGGQMVINAAATLEAVLSQRLSPAHAALFAEPEADQGRGEVDWYADLDGTVSQLADLPEPALSAATAVLQGLTRDINTLAAQLSASVDINERRLGDLLKLALEIPGPFCVKVAAGQPVLIGWGHQAAQAVHEMVPVQGMVRAAPPAVAEIPMEILPPPAPVASQAGTAAAGVAAAAVRRNIWEIDWRVLAAALLAFLPALLLLHQDVVLLERANVCRISTDDLAALSVWRQAEQDGAALDATLAGLISQVTTARCHCPAPAAAPGAPS